MTSLSGKIASVSGHHHHHPEKSQTRLQMTFDALKKMGGMYSPNPLDLPRKGRGDGTRSAGGWDSGGSGSRDGMGYFDVVHEGEEV